MLVQSFTQYQLHLSHWPLGQGQKLKVYRFRVPGWWIISRLLQNVTSFLIDLEDQDPILRTLCSWWTSTSSGELCCLVTSLAMMENNICEFLFASMGKETLVKILKMGLELSEQKSCFCGNEFFSLRAAWIKTEELHPPLKVKHSC